MHFDSDQLDNISLPPCSLDVKDAMGYTQVTLFQTTRIPLFLQYKNVVVEAVPAREILDSDSEGAGTEGEVGFKPNRCAHYQPHQVCARRHRYGKPFTESSSFPFVTQRAGNSDTLRCHPVPTRATHRAVLPSLGAVDHPSSVDPRASPAPRFLGLLPR